MSTIRQGLSAHESAIAVVEVFVRKNWKKSEDDDKTFDMDTTPHRITTIEHIRRIEVQSLNLVVREMAKGKEQGHMITFASDSTTRREVGKFIGHLQQH